MQTTEEVAIAVIQAIKDEYDVLKRVGMSSLNWLSVNDLSDLTGFERKTIERWRDRGWIRMFKPADSAEWRTAVKMWKEDQDILIEAGLLNSDGEKPSIKRRKIRAHAAQKRKDQAPCSRTPDAPNAILSATSKRTDTGTYDSTNGAKRLLPSG